MVADDERPVALVLGEVGVDAGVTPDTEQMVALRPRGEGRTPHRLEEALWCAAETLYTDASA